MSLQKIEDVESPVVGRFYLVPCVYFKLEQTFGEHWNPVIGDWHEDADIGVSRYHFHYDVRFFGKRRWELGAPYRRYYAKPEAHMARVFAAFETKPEIVYRRLKMKRQMPDFPHIADSFIVKLEAKFKDVNMKCMTCPHRGMSLKGLPVKDG